jgi:hypothetical protein
VEIDKMDGWIVVIMKNMVILQYIGLQVAAQIRKNLYLISTLDCIS